jgi:hypothetical protein
MPDFGKLAYDAYRQFSDGKSLISGAPIPEWDGMPVLIRAAWCAAADAVEDALRAEIREEETDS